MEKVMLDLLRKFVIGEKVDAQIANIFHNNAATDLLSKKLLTSSKYTASVATFVRRKTSSADAYQSTVLEKAVKEELVTVTGACGDTIEARTNQPYSGSEEPHCSRPSRR